MNELEKYGIIPRSWMLSDDDDTTIYLLSDLTSLKIQLTATQMENLKHQMSAAAEYCGRRWENGFLLIPAREHQEQPPKRYRHP